MIPLAKRIKKEAHRNMAYAQDLIIRALYSVFNEAVFHGGTAIWRCYGGNRFSEDIDVYIPKDTKRIDSLFLEFERMGFLVERKKVSENSIYSNLLFNRTAVRFEAIFAKKEGILKEYETFDGNFTAVYTLSPEGFIEEKANAYAGRRKIRDLYDIFFLIGLAEKNEKVRKAIARLIENYETPLDEGDLKVLIISGLAPTSEKMLRYLKEIRWEKRSI